MSNRFTHINADGNAHMVDVTEKAVTEREARAEAFIEMAPSTLEMIMSGSHHKGDVFATARIAETLSLGLRNGSTLSFHTVFPCIDGVAKVFSVLSRARLPRLLNSNPIPVMTAPQKKIISRPDGGLGTRTRSRMKIP